MKIKIDIINEPFKDEEWDLFVASNGGSPYHLSAWSVIFNELYGYKPLFFKAYGEGELKAVFPIFLMRTLLDKILSFPFFDYSGFVFKVGLSLSTRHKIAEKLTSVLRKLMKRERVKYARVMSLEGTGNRILKEHGFNEDRRYKFATFIIRLSRNPEVMMKRLHSSARRAIRKARRSGIVTVRVGDEIGYEKGLNIFYDLYVRRLKEFGTPPLSKEFFKLLISKFGPESIRIYIAALKGKPIATMWFHKFTGGLYYVFGAHLRQFRHLQPMSLILWTAIEDAIKNGMQFVDLCRTHIGSGVFEFKRKWGGIMKRIHVYVLSNLASKPPYIYPDAPIFRCATTLWRTLIPLTLSAVIGDKIRGLLGW